jgi:Protein of unknown function (DUF3618)
MTDMSGTQLSPDQLEAQIAAQRAQLAETVDQLGHKFDVKAQARSRLSRIRPGQVIAFAGAAILAGGLVWWSRRR